MPRSTCNWRPRCRSSSNVTIRRDKLAAGILPATEPDFQPARFVLHPLSGPRQREEEGRGEVGFRAPPHSPPFQFSASSISAFPSAPHPSLLATCPLPLLLALGLLVAGCATPNVNPPQARANSGYVDFHADSPSELCWEVSSFDARTQSFRSAFSDLKPPPGGMLRLAFVPGRHRLQVTFLNRVIAKPAEIEVEVQDGKITPVRITLTDAGTTLVQTKEESRGGTARGRYGRRTKLGSGESVMYTLSAEAAPPLAYQLKERMPYAQ